MWPKNIISSRISFTDAKSVIVSSFAIASFQNMQKLHLELPHNFNSVCQQHLHDLMANQKMAMLDFLVYPVGMQGLLIAYSTLPSMRSLVSLIHFKLCHLFCLFFADLVSSASCFVVSCHKVISREIWFRICCSCWVTLSGMIVGFPLLGFMHILVLPLISFYSLLATYFPRSFIDSSGCSSLLSNSKSSKSLVQMTRCSLVATSFRGTISTWQPATFSNHVSQSVTRPNSSQSSPQVGWDTLHGFSFKIPCRFGS
jgi:hypothetical protein